MGTSCEFIDSSLEEEKPECDHSPDLYGICRILRATVIMANRLKSSFTSKILKSNIRLTYSCISLPVLI